MKNNYCNLPQKEIHELPERFKGFLLSPFQFAVRDGAVHVPEGAFKEMIDIIAEYAVASAKTEAAPQSDTLGAIMALVDKHVQAAEDLVGASEMDFGTPKTKAKVRQAEKGVEVARLALRECLESTLNGGSPQEAYEPTLQEP